MSDIRRITLNSQPIEERSITVTPKEEFLLGRERHEALMSQLPDIMKYPYWSPLYQAYEPFLMSYFRSGAVPKDAAIWLPQLSKKIEEIGPRPAQHHAIFSEVQRLYKSGGTDLFEGYMWSEIQKFVDEIPKYIDNRKVISEYLYNPDQYSGVIYHLLQDSVFSELEREYRDFCGVPYAVYVYRHCMIDGYQMDKYSLEPKLFELLKDRTKHYTLMFSKVFDYISDFIGNDIDVYKWYTGKVRDIIVHAWESSLDLSSKRSVITNKDVFSMEVWLSEQLTDYVSSLPCTYTAKPDAVFIMDALDAALTNEVSSSDLSFIYAYCIPKSYFKSFMDRLSEFYWDVKEGHFVELLRSLNKSAYAQDTTGTVKSPEIYDEELAARGFPLP